MPLTFYYLKPPAHRLLLIALVPKSVIIIPSQKKTVSGLFAMTPKW